MTLNANATIGDMIERVQQPRCINRDSPDDSRAEVNICAFPTFLQDRRELRTAASTWGGRNGGRRIDLVILPGIWTYSSRRLLWNGQRSNASCWRWWRLRS